MKKDCFGDPGQWYKGNLHSHTTNSDGHLTPAQAVALFRQYGYSFLCLSEHDYYTDLRAELDREDFILLPGVEASSWLVQPPKDPAALQELAALKEKMPRCPNWCSSAAPMGPDWARPTTSTASWATKPCKGRPETMFCTTANA